jgi:hypothetical protein
MNIFMQKSKETNGIYEEAVECLTQLEPKSRSIIEVALLHFENDFFLAQVEGDTIRNLDKEKMGEIILGTFFSSSMKDVNWTKVEKDLFKSLFQKLEELRSIAPDRFCEGLSPFTKLISREARVW